MDKRLQILLIIIALGVWANFLATIFTPTPTIAYGVTDVNIQEIGGYPVTGSALPVDLKKIGGLFCMEPIRVDDVGD